MDELHTALQIKIINDRLEREANNSLREKKLTSVQMHVLMILLGEDGHTLPLKEVERRLHVAQPTAAGVVVRLEQKGFLESKMSEEDRRVKLLRLTDDGKRQCMDCISHAEEAERRVREALTEKEYDRLQGLLDKIIRSMGIAPHEDSCRDSGSLCPGKNERNRDRKEMKDA